MKSKYFYYMGAFLILVSFFLCFLPAVAGNQANMFYAMFSQGFNGLAFIFVLMFLSLVLLLIVLFAEFYDESPFISAGIAGASSVFIAGVLSFFTGLICQTNGQGNAPGLGAIMVGIFLLLAAVPITLGIIWKKKGKDEKKPDKKPMGKGNLEKPTSSFFYDSEMEVPAYIYELIGLKKLLDQNAISYEDYEKKKWHLLNADEEELKEKNEEEKKAQNSEKKKEIADDPNHSDLTKEEEDWMLKIKTTNPYELYATGIITYQEAQKVEEDKEAVQFHNIAHTEYEKHLLTLVERILKKPLEKK